MTLGATWKIEARSSTGASFTTRWIGFGQVIPTWGHFLIGGLSYAQSPADDDYLVSGITDAGALRLVKGTTVVDTVCYYFDAATMAALDATFGCAGTPVSNLPHDNTAASNVDASIERKPGGTQGNCSDTGDNASDFRAQSPATPLSTSSAPTP